MLTDEEKKARHAQVHAILKEAGAKIRALGTCPPYLIILPDLQDAGFHTIGNGMSHPGNRFAFLRAIHRVCEEHDERESVRN